MNMMLKTNRLIISAASMLFLFSCATQPPSPPPQPPPDKSVETPKPEYLQIAQRDAETIGQKIWMNEGSAKIENLTVWNKGENFASMGIGHFIWYPPGIEGPYQETFPELVAFLQQQGAKIPTWLQKTPDAPWNSFEAFNFQGQTPELLELRTLLVNTIPLQVQFIIKRLEQALPKMLDTLPTLEQREHVFKQFYRVAQIPNGVYALIDYVNFKGEGINPKERYRGEGWGLLQVLEHLPDNSDNVMAEFAKAANFVLKRRIQNAPPERNESRWYPGWQNRIKTYTYQL